MGEQNFDLINHYKKLWFYNWHRHEGDNMSEMRTYFTNILIGELEEYLPLHGKHVLDVGGAYGEFCVRLTELRDTYAVNLDPQLASYERYPLSIHAWADEIPFPDNTFDVSISRGVFEHIPAEKRLASLQEMLRVTRPGGLIYILIPPWFNPHAGHGFKPFHYFSFGVAKYLARVIKGKNTPEDKKTYQDVGLHPITFRGMMNLINQLDCDLIGTKDTHFRLHFMTRIFLANELLVPAVAFIMQKPERQPA